MKKIILLMILSAFSALSQESFYHEHEHGFGVWETNDLYKYDFFPTNISGTNYITFLPKKIGEIATNHDGSSDKHNQRITTV